MRVLIAPDQMDGLPAQEVGTCLSSAWSGHDVVNIAMGESGHGWLQATADMMGSEISLLPVDQVIAMMAHAGDDLVVAVQPADGGHVATGPEDHTPPIDVTATSAPLGHAVARALAEAPESATVLVDLAGLRSHDAGAGFFAALGAVADGSLTGGSAGLARIGAVDLGPLRERLAGRRLVGVVPSGELGSHLLGLRGITSIIGRETGMAAEQMLAVDGALEQFVALVAPEQATEAGAGACGGLGWAIRALGGELTTGPALSIERHGLDGLARQADLIVTACSSFDFASRGGGVVAAMARLAEESLSPCIVFGGQVLIGSREMRTMGIETAYPVFAEGTGEDPAATLRTVASRVSGSWMW